MSVKTIKQFLAIGAVGSLVAACVYVDESLGSNFIPSNQIYEVHMAEFPLSNVKLGFSDSLSAYSDSRITIGALRDERFGLTTRSSAFTVVPVEDSLDMGYDPEPLYFHFSAVRDTTSVADFSQQKIIQSVNVYELKQVLDSTFLYTCDDRYDTFYDSSERITVGVPIYSGGDSLSFDFSDAYTRKMIELFKEKPGIAGDMDAFLEKMPGIYISVDPPLGYGGRINMFDCPTEVDDYGYVTGGYAVLVMKTKYTPTSEYHDTTFIFYFGPEEKTTDTDQYAFNISTHESMTTGFDFDEHGFVEVGAEMPVEGGVGLKPVFNAMEIKTLMLGELEEQGLGVEEVIINKATIMMPYEEPSDYDYYYLMPPALSPTCKLTYDANIIKADGSPMRYVYYANLTDSSVDDENHGDINRSLDYYAPDITHHVQEILKTPDDTLATGKYDVWMLILAPEEITTDTSNSDLAEYYEYLAYQSYYSSMYGSGYGYGYDSDSYSNYYYYMYMAEAYANASTTSSQNILDKDKFYAAVLTGPDSANPPMLKVTYSSVKEQETDGD